MLTLKNLTVKTKNKTILKDINYTFEKGKIYALMGPNGSGKSSLANTILGHPNYQISKDSEIIFINEKINELSTDKRVQRGLFMTFQSPVALSGVTIFQLLQNALNSQKDFSEIDKQAHKIAKELKIHPDLLSRSLNENASGGERKKLELLQAAILNPKFIIFDEIDTGVDIDALKIIANFMEKYKKDKTYLIITHYSRILEYINPDSVLVIENGKITQSGNAELAQKIERKGYNNNMQRSK